MKRNINFLNKSTIELENMIQINLNIGLQITEVFDYLNGELPSKKKFYQLDKKISESFNTIQNANSATGRMEGRNKIQDFKNAKIIEDNYKNYKAIVGTLWVETDKNEIYDIIHNQLFPIRNKYFINRVDRYIKSEHLQTDNAYDQLLFNLGMLSLFSKKATNNIENAKLASSYFLSVEKVFSDLNLLVHELNNYILFQSHGSIRKIEHINIEMIKGFKNVLFNVALKDSRVDGKNAEYIMSIKQNIDELNIILIKIISLIASNDYDSAFRVKVEEFEPYYENVVLKKLMSVIADGKQQIRNEHIEVMNVYTVAIRNSLVILISFSILIIFITARIINGMLSSLNLLKTGSEILGKGDLNYRIDIRSNDEFRNLSYSFNSMAEKLQNSKEYTDNILYSMNDTLFVLSANDTIKSVNNALCRLLEYTPEDLKGNSISTILNSDHLNCSIIADMSHNDLVNNVEVIYYTKNKRKIYILFSSTIMRDKDGKLAEIICAGQDITKRKEIEKQLEYDVAHDSLTGLSNRALLMERLGQSFKFQKLDSTYLFAILIMDLDRFKIINDSLGHMVGDALLASIPKRLKNLVRPQDTFARMGGDEFAILLDNIRDVRDVTRVADRINESLKKPFMLADREVIISVSIGIAQNKSGYQWPEEILRDADTALYEAKELGRARYKMFDDKMHYEAVKLMEMEADLRVALNNIDKELFLVFQPIISLASSKVVGGEVLLRWDHPKKGMILPLDFIGLAEETGMIIPMGKWILKTACEKKKIWEKMGYQNIFLNINFSARQFHQQNIVEEIEETLRQTGVKASEITVEITESVAMLNTDLTINTLKRISDLGIKISLDDFGTGYSSMAYIKQFKLGSIKIDRSFIRDIPDSTDDIEISKAIVAMSHNLNLEVIAEGVETKEQHGFLRSINCNKAQGFYFSKPLLEEQFLSYLDKRTTLPDCK